MKDKELTLVYNKQLIRKTDKRKYFFGSIELRKNNNVINNVINAVINNVIKFYTLAHRKPEDRNINFYKTRNFKCETGSVWGKGALDLVIPGSTAYDCRLALIFSGKYLIISKSSFVFIPLL